MRLALIYLGRRGAGGKISIELARELRLRHEVIAILSKSAEHLGQWKEIPIRLLPVNTYNDVWQAIRSLFFPRQILSLALQIRSLKPDVLIFPMFHPWNGILQRLLKDIPSVIFVHDPQPHPDWTGRFYAGLENFSIHQASFCITMSYGLIDALKKRCGKDKPIAVIPIGPLNYGVSEPQQCAEVPRILFFGRIVPYKGLEVLLKAYTMVREKHPCQLLIAGEGDLISYREWLKNAPDIEVVNRWIPDEEIGSLFARSDIVVLPYTSASQSGIIPIAASFGLPVIATHTGGLPEQIEHGRSGLLVSPGDSKELADAILFLLENPDVAQRYGQALYQRFLQDFNWSLSTQRFENILADVIHAKGIK